MKNTGHDTLAAMLVTITKNYLFENGVDFDPGEKLIDIFSDEIRIFWLSQHIKIKPILNYKERN